jgi:hypothetical protein
MSKQGQSYQENSPRNNGRNIELYHPYSRIIGCESSSSYKSHKKENRQNNINTNGYVILARDKYDEKEEVYGYTKNYNEAQNIANEAVQTGTKRLCYLNEGYRYSHNKFYTARVVNLDTRIEVGTYTTEEDILDKAIKRGTILKSIQELHK